MQVGVMITNGAPHPRAKWAEATASQIVDIADSVAGERRGAAIKLQAAIIDILEGHHGQIKDGERASLKKHGADCLSFPNDPDYHLSVAEAVAEIIEVTKVTQWEEDFAQPVMAEQLSILLNQHFRSSIDIERSWHCDRNPADPKVQAYLSEGEQK